MTKQKQRTGSAPKASRRGNVSGHPGRAGRPHTQRPSTERPSIERPPTQLPSTQHAPTPAPGAPDHADPSASGASGGWWHRAGLRLRASVRGALGRALPWLACALAAAGHVFLTDGVSRDLFAVALTAPAVVTLIVLREHRFRALHRWVGLWALLVIALPEYATVAFFIVETWVFHAFWVAERTTPLADIVPLPHRPWRKPR